MKLFSRQELTLQLYFLAGFAIRETAAGLAFTGSLNGLTAGAPFDVTWSGAVGTSTLTLLSGTTVINDIAFGISDQFLSWSPYAFTPAGVYTLKLEDTSGQTAISSQFNMLAAGTSSTPLHFTNTGFDITAGSSFNVTWTGAKGTTTLSLQQGDANSISTADVIAFGMTNEYLAWTPYATTTPGQYVLRLDDTSNDFAYGLIFNMQSPGAASTSSVTPSEPTRTQAPVVQSLSTTSKISTISTSSNTPTSSSKADTSKSTSTGTTSTSSTSTSAIGTSQTTSPSPSSSTNTSNSAETTTSGSPLPTTKFSLSSGAKAGIGIGCSLAFIFLLTTLFLLYRQWKAAKRDVMELPGTSAERLGFVGYYGRSAGSNEEVKEVVELRGEGRVEELDGYGARGL